MSMVPRVGLLVIFVICVCVYVIVGTTDRKDLLGCFTKSSDGLTKNLTKKPDYLQEYPRDWCVARCEDMKYTFAGTKQNTWCVCGHMLGSATRTRLTECLSPCHKKRCGRKNRLLVYIIVPANVILGSDALSEDKLISANVMQTIILGCGVLGGTVLVFLLIHFVRVWRRRNYLMSRYLTHLELGGSGLNRKPPSACAISNQMCSDIMCCCCCQKADDIDDSDMEELLHEMKIDPKDLTSRNGNRNGSRGGDEKWDIEKMRRILVNDPNAVDAVPLESIKHLADHYYQTKGKNGAANRKPSPRLSGNASQLGVKAKKKSRSELPPQLASPHHTISSPSKLCRQNNGSSSSSLENAVATPTSDLSVFSQAYQNRETNRSANARRKSTDVRGGESYQYDRLLPSGSATDRAGAVGHHAADGSGRTRNCGYHQVSSRTERVLPALWRTTSADGRAEVKVRHSDDDSESDTDNDSSETTINPGTDSS